MRGSSRIVTLGRGGELLRHERRAERTSACDVLIADSRGKTLYAGLACRSRHGGTGTPRRGTHLL
jgi:hypothetical protein